MGITVAITGPTGEVGISAVTALERDPVVHTIIGMARRPFDPALYGWTKTTWLQGDPLDRGAVDTLVRRADVVIHLAVAVAGSRAESARINVRGCRNLFEATVCAPRPRRLVYGSSVAAYGYHSDNPVPLTEDVPPRGSPEHCYSEQKAACEAQLAEITKGSSLQVFVLRPCIVAGPEALALAETMPCKRLSAPMRALSRVVSMLKPIVPDPGVALQLVHHDDVAAAIALMATAPVPAGAYNIAGDGVVTVTDVANALRCRPVRVPAVAAATASAAIARLPLVPSALEWLHVTRQSVVMDTAKAKRYLGWYPTHSSADTLAALASAV
ncbi:NAD-dependent epimerase/dehydratase family protein [Mycobacterium basiliense]|uniref:NAD-dependent epimerase/dehydratase family protein n=1 Tax=Mycobacterium basiliense TaxID=2094119 RepID=UPI0013015BCC|nr:NAD-dependent epimerase/dehydratase family protein [Mycobacterium basiliense]